MSDHIPRIDALRIEGAPRDLEWTGERMLPWVEDPTIAYEHLHRYAFAAELVEGLRVLDLGCGEGYGTALLATRAAEVTGIDVDAAAIRHAAATYKASNLHFGEGSAGALARFADGQFDVVVCFEVIEHVAEQEAIVAEVRRVLAPGGIFVCSTPERDAYRAWTREENPYHVRELSLTEFRALLTTAFPVVALWGQLPIAGSLLEPVAPATTVGSTHYVRRDGQFWDFAEPPEPLYLVAVASGKPLAGTAGSLLVDPAQALSAQHRARLQRAERELREARIERAEAEERIQGYRAGMKRREAEVREVVGAADALRAELVAVSAESQLRGEAVTALERRVARVEGSFTWRILEAMRARLRRPDGTPNAASRLLTRALGAAERRASRRNRVDEP